ncbi:MAG: Ig domain-containing protein [Mogibacterium sp.]|nr:Ig domain-containing protein [Mogibacterium sp.]
MKNKIFTKTMVVLTLAISILLSGIPVLTVHAATPVNYVDNAVDFSLGTSQTFSTGDADYVKINSARAHAKVFKIKMPKQGILKCSLLTQTTGNSWKIKILSVEKPDVEITTLASKETLSYDSSKDGYFFESSTSLDKGEYYCCIYFVGGRVTKPSTLTMMYVEPTVAVTDIVMDSENITIEQGSSHRLTATVFPTNATNPSITWKSENNAVATVSDGIVSAVASGTTRIIATSVDGGVSASCTVTVPELRIPVNDIQINTASMKLIVGETGTLQASIDPLNADEQGVIWTSSAPEVASVSNGIVTGKLAGKAIITATSEDGIHSASCTVVVGNPDRTKEINAVKKSRVKIKSLVRKSKRKITVKYSKISSVDNVRYQIAYRAGKGKWKTIKTSKTTKTLKSLARKKTYTIRVRSYKVINGNTYYGKWSAKKRIKTR